MTVLSALFHIVNFILPAVFVGGFLAVCAPLALRSSTKRARASVLRLWLINSLVGIAALALGLWFYGVDGKIYSYLFMIISSSLLQLFVLKK